MKTLISTLILLCLSSAIWAQGCVTCTNTAAQLGQDAAKGLNGGILYLIVVPFCFVASVGVWWYRKNKASQLIEEENI